MMKLMTDEEMVQRLREDRLYALIGAALPFAMQMAVQPVATGVMAADSSGKTAHAMRYIPELAAKQAISTALAVLKEVEVGS